ncbi:MAG: hypothetical protein ACK55Z_34645, partial [bacterium]
MAFFLRDLPLLRIDSTRMVEAFAAVSTEEHFFFGRRATAHEAKVFVVESLSLRHVHAPSIYKVRDVVIIDNFVRRLLQQQT